VKREVRHAEGDHYVTTWHVLEEESVHLLKINEMNEVDSL
jgi:hypothetical protein